MDTEIEVREEPLWEIETVTQAKYKSKLSQELVPILKKTYAKESTACVNKAEENIPSSQSSRLNGETADRHISSSMLIEEANYKSDSEAISNSFEVNNTFFRKKKEYLPQHKCKYCSESFELPSELELHSLTHEHKVNEKFTEEDEVKYKCEICKMMCASVLDLKTHKLLHKECEKRFTATSHLKAHKLINENKRQYKCKTCGKSYNQNHSLKYHIVTHLEVKQHKYVIFEKCFTNESGVNEHIAIDASDSSYKCELCEMTFINKAGLRKHIVSHGSMKPYKCEMCDKSFARKAGLKLHKLVHEGKR